MTFLIRLPARLSTFKANNLVMMRRRRMRWKRMVKRMVMVLLTISTFNSVNLSRPVIVLILQVDIFIKKINISQFAQFKIFAFLLLMKRDHKRT